MLTLWRKGIVPWSWIVDTTRRRIKPSSWSGLADLAEDAARAYRLDCWSRQTDYVEVFVEKEGRVGVIEPVTKEYDLYLTPNSRPGLGHVSLERRRGMEADQETDLRHDRQISHLTAGFCRGTLCSPSRMAQQSRKCL